MQRLIMLVINEKKFTNAIENWSKREEIKFFENRYDRIKLLKYIDPKHYKD